MTHGTLIITKGGEETRRGKGGEVKILRVTK